MHKNKIFYTKIAIWLLAIAPILRLVLRGLQDNLTANPIEFIERSTGTWALIFLLLSLSMTPIRLLFGEIWQIQLRRLLGLWMFAFACLHFATYIWLDFSFDWQAITKDIIKHPFVIVGFSAFVLSIPLAATSNNAMIKRLRGNWKKLHQLVYLIAILVCMHFWWLVKKDVTEPFIYSILLLMLFAIRLNFIKKS